MTIGLDATPLTVPYGGIHRYTVELCRALAGRFPEDAYWLMSDQKFENPCPELPNVKLGNGPNTALERRWWLWGLERAMSALNTDVFHGTNFSVPYRNARPSVLTLHDLSPWLDPVWHSEAGRVRRRTPILLKLGCATMVITDSEAVRREAIARFHIAPTQVAAVPLAASCVFRPMPSQIAAKPFFLYAGTLEPRKNISLLLNAWRELRKALDIDLVLAGRRRADFPELPPEPGLRVLGPVSDEALRGLYSTTVACLYPSFYEGFGLPVLEAMQCGCAVITSKDPAISEVAGDAAIRLDANDVRHWIQAMQSMLSDSDSRERLRERALSRSAIFSWSKTAQRTRDVYVEAIQRFRKTA